MNNLFNETVINIYMHYHLHIISFSIYKQTMKITNHMNTNIFTWKPSDWEENHGSLTILLCQD